MLTPEAFRDGLPWDELDRLRDEEPIFQMVLPDHTIAWNLVRYEDVAEGLRSVNHFATPNVDAQVQFAPTAIAPDQPETWSLHAMILLSPPVHGEYRHQFTRLMKRDLLEQFRLRARRIAEEFAREVREKEIVDAVEHCAAPAATAFVCDYLRISPQNRDYFRRLAAVFMGDTLPPIALGSYGTADLRPRSVCGFHGSPGRAAMDIVAESWGHAPWLDREFVSQAGRWEIEDLGLQMLAAGVAGLRNCLVCAIQLLAPVWDDVKRNREALLIRLPTVADEVIRHATPLLRSRRVLTVDIQRHGQKMLAGDTVLLWLVGANFDEKRFPNPRSFQPFRSPNPHLSFGGGAHHCLGAPLARLEVEEFLRAIILNWENVEIIGSSVRFASNIVNEVSSMSIRVD
jgi:cholest-4-en-3-one 26-monooxygenase